MVVLPEKVKYIIDKMYENGFEAFAVGGCIRDSLLGREPKDWDITTDASPKQVKAIFNRTIDTGIEHGTVTIMLGKEGFEITTYRIDGEYEDSRHPKQVTFTKNLVEDLKRRDFTINAMAYNDREGLVDAFDGEKDLADKIIRCVGDAHDRFTEDALRIMRAVRFSAQLGFLIEQDTLNAMKDLSVNLMDISAERIKSELDKLLLSDNPDRLFVMMETGITKVVLPEFDDMVRTTQENPNHIYDVGHHTVMAVKMLDSHYDEYGIKAVNNLDDKLDFAPLEDEKIRLALKWTMLLHDIGKPSMKTIDDNKIAHFKKHEIQSEKMAKDVFARLKFDNYTSKLALHLIKWHDYRFSDSIKSVRRVVSKVEAEYFPLLMLVKRADMLGQNPDTFAKKCDNLIMAQNYYNEIMDSKDCLSVKELAVNGKDLISAGVRPGPQLGELIAMLLDMVIDNPELNNKETLLDIVAKKVNKE